jgi:hypothetical protein
MKSRLVGKPNCSIREGGGGSGGQKDEHGEAISRFSQYFERA